MATLLKTSFRINLLIPPVLLGLFLLCAPSNYFVQKLFLGFAMYDAQRILELLFVTLINGYFIFSLRYLRSGDLRLGFASLAYPLRLLLIVFCGCLIVSAALAALPKWAFLELALDANLVLLVCGFALWLRFYGVLGEIFLWGTIFCAVLGYELLFGLAFFSSHYAITSGNLFAGFMNARFFNHYQIWSLALLAWPLFSYPRWPIKPFWKPIVASTIIVVTGIWYLLAILTDGKASYFSLLGALLLLGFFFKKEIWFWFCLNLKIFLGVVLIASFPLAIRVLHAISWGGFLLRHSAAYAVGCWNNDIVSRFELIRDAWKIFLTHPFFGVGPMHFSYYKNTIAAHPHNFLLLILAEFGLLVGVPVLFFIFFGLKRWFSFVVQKERANAGNAFLLVSLSITILTAFFYALTDDGILITPISQIMMAVVLGWMMALYRGRGATLSINTSVSIITIKQQLFLIVLFVGITFLLWSLVLPQLPNLTAQEISWYLKAKPQVFLPRFWLQGFI